MSAAVFVSSTFDWQKLSKALDRAMSFLQCNLRAFLWRCWGLSLEPALLKACDPPLRYDPSEIAPALSYCPFCFKTVAMN